MTRTTGIYRASFASLFLGGGPLVGGLLALAHLAVPTWEQNMKTPDYAIGYGSFDVVVLAIAVMTGAAVGSVLFVAEMLVLRASRSRIARIWALPVVCAALSAALSVAAHSFVTGDALPAWALTCVVVVVTGAVLAICFAIETPKQQRVV